MFQDNIIYISAVARIINSLNRFVSGIIDEHMQRSVLVVVISYVSHMPPFVRLLFDDVSIHGNTVYVWL